MNRLQKPRILTFRYTVELNARLSVVERDVVTLVNELLCLSTPDIYCSWLVKVKRQSVCTTVESAAAAHHPRLLVSNRFDSRMPL